MILGEKLTKVRNEPVPELEDEAPGRERAVYNVRIGRGRLAEIDGYGAIA